MPSAPDRRRGRFDQRRAAREVGERERPAHRARLTAWSRRRNRVQLAVHARHVHHVTVRAERRRRLERRTRLRCPAHFAFGRQREQPARARDHVQRAVRAKRRRRRLATWPQVDRPQHFGLDAVARWRAQRVERPFDVGASARSTEAEIDRAVRRERRGGVPGRGVRRMAAPHELERLALRAALWACPRVAQGEQHALLIGEVDRAVGANRGRALDVSLRCGAVLHLEVTGVERAHQLRFTRPVIGAAAGVLRVHLVHRPAHCLRRRYARWLQRRLRRKRRRNRWLGGYGRRGLGRGRRQRRQRKRSRLWRGRFSLTCRQQRQRRQRGKATKDNAAGKAHSSTPMLRVDERARARF